MSIEADFADMMVDEIVVAKVASRDVYGEKTLGTGATHRARVVHKMRMVRTDSGDEVASRTQAYVFGSPGITVDDRITLPDGTNPPVLAVERYPDQNGAHHEVVFFGVLSRGGGG